MKKAFTLLLLLIIAFAFIASERHDVPNIPKITHNLPMTVDSKQLNANTINTWFRNNGSYNRDPLTGNSGFEWPRGSGKFARYASGLWLGAEVDGDTLIAMAEYDYEYLPGYTDANGNPVGDTDPLYRVYKITRNVNDQDRAEWPNALLGNSDQGAPVFFDETSGTWQPLDLGYQTLYYVYTDSYPGAHANRAGSTAPLKADIKQTNFAFNFGGALGQIAFTQLVIINRSDKVWQNAYLTAWSDDDLGDAGDDMVAVDTNLGLGYTYNGDNQDGVYGAAPPAVGFDFFRGAIIQTNDPNDTAYICDGKTRRGLVGYRQQGLNVFGWYANGHATYGDPRAYYETYRQMKGLTRDGATIVNPVTGQPTTFIYSGDPVTGSGWVSGPMTPEDQRFMQSTGPFTMNPGDTQVIVLGQVIARGNTNLNSITELRRVDAKAQQIYDNCFNVPAPPPSPNVTAYAPGNGKIYLTWDDAAERVREFNLYDSSYYNFEGYNIYAIRRGTDGSEKDDRILLATFDVKNNVGDIFDTIEAPEYGALVYTLVQKGSNTGISRTFVIDRDPFTGGSIINGTPYCFSVTAYSYDANSGWSVGTPKVNESSISGNVQCVTPQALAQGTIPSMNFGDTVTTSNRRDLAVMPIVVDPLALQSATYKVQYAIYDNRLAYDLYKNDQLVLNAVYDFGGQDTARVVDGLMFVNEVIRDSGVVKDRNDYSVADNNSFDKGWEYLPAGNRWVTGLDTNAARSAKLFGGRQFQSRSMSISWPYQGSPSAPSFRTYRTRVTANGFGFTEIPNSGGVFTGGPLRKVALIFGVTQKAYRYTAKDENGVPLNVLETDTNLSNTPFADFVDINMQAYEIDELGNPGRQLNLAFVDADANGVWDPDTSRLGKYQILYVLASNYSANPITYYTIRNPGLTLPSTGFPSFDIMYAWVPKVRKGPNGEPLQATAGDTLKIYPYTITRPEFIPGSPVYYTFNVQGTIIGDLAFASANNQIDKVNVFPNPYMGQNRLENNPINRFVTFTNLPSQASIYIYTLSGVLVRKIDRLNADPKNSSERWDLRNHSDIPVASGMYIAVIDAPGIGAKILKLAILTPEERLDTF